MFNFQNSILEKLIVHRVGNSEDIHLIKLSRVAIDLSENGINGEIKRCEPKSDQIKIPYTIIPFRRQGRLRCLPHQDEGLIKVGGVDKWAKGETTARNEKRFVSEMQQNKVKYKEDGISNLKYELINIEMYTNNCKLINVKL